jgi:hypothetical protein
VTITPTRNIYRHFDGMSWPYPGDELNDLEDLLRYGPDDLSDTSVTREQELLIASVLAAYRDLVWSTISKRNRVIKELRK